MGREGDINAVIDVKPFGVVIHFIRDNGDARHKAKSLRKVFEFKDFGDETRVSFAAVGCGRGDMGGKIALWGVTNLFQCYS